MTAQGAPSEQIWRVNLCSARSSPEAIIRDTYTTKTITVALDTPTTPKITRALRLLLDELNTTPPTIPGDHRPITYKIKTA